MQCNPSTPSIITHELLYNLVTELGLFMLFCFWLWLMNQYSDIQVWSSFYSQFVFPFLLLLLLLSNLFPLMLVYEDLTVVAVNCGEWFQIHR